MYNYSKTEGCGVCGSAPGISRIEIKEDSKEIRTAQDVMDVVFKKLKKGPENLTCNTATLKKLGFADPAEVKDISKINDAFVSAVAEKILEKLDAKVAIITSKISNCSKVGDQVNYLVVTQPNEEAVTQPNEEAVDENLKKVEEFGPTATDGVIEDLIGPIEVVPAPAQPKPRLV